MRWFVQMAVLAALVATFALQIPKSALFFKPVAMKTAAPRAAFVTMSDAAYARLMRQIRTVNWPGATRGWNDGTMSLGAGAFVLDDSPHPVPELPLPKAFTGQRDPVNVELPRLTSPLQPASLAMPPSPPTPAKPAAAPADEKRPDALLDLDNFESLKERI